MFKIKNQKGFIAIVAIGMFAILALFGIIVQTAVIETSRNLRNADNFYVANDVAESILEHVQYQLKNAGPGFTLASACEYNDEGQPEAIKFADISEKGSVFDTNDTTNPNEPELDPEGGEEEPEDEPDKGIKEFKKLDEQFDPNTELCPTNIAGINSTSGINAKNVKVVVNVKGRSFDDEAIKVSGCPSNYTSDSSCYIVPHPGTGTAGGRCDLYEPAFSADSDSQFVPNKVVGGNGPGSTLDPNESSGIQHIDHTCNWNRLTFGSTLTDRISLPLYYEGPDGNIINPYNDPDGLIDFVLRLRTPCLPCVYDTEDVVTGESRFCYADQDPTICSENERYKFDLSEGPDDIVVQWQMQGECDGQSCGIVGTSEFDIPLQVDKGTSISELDIQNVHPFLGVYGVIGSFNYGLDTNGYVNKPLIQSFLGSSQEIVFQMLLVDKLISENNENIPHLEYQIISGDPLPNYNTIAEVFINVDGNIVTKELAINKDSDLIDFAIQN